MNSNEQISEQEYLSKFAVLAGYLPSQRQYIQRWFSELTEKAGVPRGEASFQPSVQKLAELIRLDAVVRMYVTQMIEQVPEAYKNGINTPDDLLERLNIIIQEAPLYNPDPQRQHFFPISALFVYMMYTPSGYAAFNNTDFNQHLREILQAWCVFLDSSASQYVLNEGEYGWLSPPAYEQFNLSEFVIPDRDAPHWGFPSFNAFFHREIKPQCRPIAQPDNPKIIVSALYTTSLETLRKVMPFG